MVSGAFRESTIDTILDSLNSVHLGSIYFQAKWIAIVYFSLDYGLSWLRQRKWWTKNVREQSLVEVVESNKGKGMIEMRLLWFNRERAGGEIWLNPEENCASKSEGDGSLWSTILWSAVWKAAEIIITNSL